MVGESRKVFIITIVLIAVLGLWGVDRYNLVRRIKQERWRWKEELVEKEVKLRMMEEKMRVEQKEKERLPLEQEEIIQKETRLKPEGVLQEDQEPVQLFQEQEEATEQAEPQAQSGQIFLDKEDEEPRGIEEKRLSPEALSEQEKAAERELAEMERMYRERESAHEEAETEAQQEE